MRLSRSVFVPAKFSCQCGRHGVIKTSNTWLDKVSFEMSDVWPKSIVQCRGKSITPSVPSAASKTKKASKRVSKDVRKSMVEKYVDKYRTMNAGKFPTASDAKKNVGGGYYVVRHILQELKYNSSLTIGLQEVSRARKPEENVDTSGSQTESDSTIFYDVKRNRVFVDKEVDEEKSLSEAEEFSSNYATVDESILNLPIEEPSSLNVESEEGSQSLISVESDKSKDSGTQSHHVMDECEGSLHHDLESTEINLKEMASEDFLKYDELYPDDKKQKSRMLEIRERESLKVPAPAAEPESNSSLWQNLKSFANGILGMWRRS